MRWISCVTVAVAMFAPVSRATAQHQAAARAAFIVHIEGSASFTPAPLPLSWQQPKRETPVGRIALQFLASGAGAAGAGLGAYMLLDEVGTTRVKGDEGYTRPALVGYMTGSVVGATLGAHLVGTAMGGRSPVWATALGAVVGTTPLLVLGIDEPYLPLIGVALGWIPQAALATAGFRMGETR